MSSAYRGPADLVGRMRAANPHFTIVAQAVAKLYIAAPDPYTWSFTGIVGVVSCLHDHSLDTCVLQIHELNGLSMMFEYEVYEDMEFKEALGCPHLYTFEMDDWVAGLAFSDPMHATHFAEAMRSSIPRSDGAATYAALRNQERKASGIGSRVKRFFAGGPSGRTRSRSRSRSRARSVSTSSSGRGRSASSASRGRRAPRRESQVLTWGLDSTVGIEEDGSLDPDEMPAAWRALFRQAGIKKGDLRDPETAEALLSVMADSVSHDDLSADPTLAGTPQPAGQPHLTRPSIDGTTGLVITENPILTTALVAEVEQEVGPLPEVIEEVDEEEEEEDEEDNGDDRKDGGSVRETKDGDVVVGGFRGSPFSKASASDAASVGSARASVRSSGRDAGLPSGGRPKSGKYTELRLPPHKRASIVGGTGGATSATAASSPVSAEPSPSGRPLSTRSTGSARSPSRSPRSVPRSPHRSPRTRGRGISIGTKIIKDVARDKRKTLVAAKGGLMAAIAAQKFKGKLRPVSVNRRVSVVKVNGMSSGQKDSLMSRLAATLDARRAQIDDGDDDDSDSGWSSDEY